MSCANSANGIETVTTPQKKQAVPDSIETEGSKCENGEQRTNITRPAEVQDTSSAMGTVHVGEINTNHADNNSKVNESIDKGT